MSVDEDLVAELEASDEPVSTQVNSALRSQLEHRRRQRLLREWLDRMDAEEGPVDEAIVQKYMDLLR